MTDNEVLENQGLAEDKNYLGITANDLEFLQGLPLDNPLVRGLAKVTNWFIANAQKDCQHRFAPENIQQILRVLKQNDNEPHEIGCVLNGMVHFSHFTQLPEMRTFVSINSDIKTILKFEQAVYGALATVAMVHLGQAQMSEQETPEQMAALFNDRGYDEFALPVIPTGIESAPVKLQEQIASLNQDFRSYPEVVSEIPKWQDLVREFSGGSLNALADLCQGLCRIDWDLKHKVAAVGFTEVNNG